MAHYQYFHLKKNKLLIIPKKRDTALLNEKLNDENTDEMGIDENKKKILLREFKPNLHKISIENRNINTLISPKNEKMKNFVKPEKIEKLTFNKIFEYNIKYEKQKFPEDNNRASMKAEEKNAKKKTFVQLNRNNYNIIENSSCTSNNNVYYSQSPQIQTSHINYSDDCFNPLFFLNEARKHNNTLTEGTLYSQNINYINLNDLERNSLVNKTNLKFI